MDSSINIGYKNLIAGRNIGNGVLFGCGEENRQKEAFLCLTAQKEQGCFEISEIRKNNNLARYIRTRNLLTVEYYEEIRYNFIKN